MKSKEIISEDIKAPEIDEYMSKSIEEIKEKYLSSEFKQTGVEYHNETLERDKIHYKAIDKLLSYRVDLTKPIEIYDYNTETLDKISIEDTKIIVHRKIRNVEYVNGVLISDKSVVKQYIKYASIDIPYFEFGDGYELKTIDVLGDTPLKLRLEDTPQRANLDNLEDLPYEV